MKLSEQITRRQLFVAFGTSQQTGGLSSVDLAATRDQDRVILTASDGSAAQVDGADNSTAGVMTAADKTTLDSLTAGKTRDVETRGDIPATQVAAEVTHLRAAGYAAAGDGGAARYRRVGSEPDHALKVQSGDGDWWELVPDPAGINVYQAGAAGDDVTDDSQAFLDALDFGSHNLSGVKAATNAVIVPPGAYYLGSTTLQLKKVSHIRGSGSGLGNAPRPAVLRWDANVTGMIVHNENTIGATTEGTPSGIASGSVIEGLKLQGGGGALASVTDGTKGHGIWLRARAVLRDIWVTDFAGNGVNIVATLGGPPDREGNANQFRLDSIRASSNYGNGVYLDGADVNAGAATLIDASDNGRWGIHDGSFLGNVWTGCHTSANGTAWAGGNGAGESSIVEFGGNLYAANAAATEADLVATQPGTDESVWIDLGSGSSTSIVPAWQSGQPEGTYFHGGDFHTDNANARNLFLNSYIEGNSAPPQIVKPTLILGGKGMSNFKGSGHYLGDGHVLGELEIRPDPTKSPDRDWSVVFSDENNVLQSWKVDGDSVGLQMEWDENRGHFELNHGGVKNIVAFTTSLNGVNYGRSAPPGGGYAAFHRGFFLGNLGNGRHMDSDDSAPTSGDHARGDIVWNRNASDGGILGWVCTADGTPGTWVEIRGTSNQTSGAGQAALSNATGGTRDGTISAVSGSGDDATINDNFTELHVLLNEVRTALVNFGLMKGGA